MVAVVEEEEGGEAGAEEGDEEGGEVDEVDIMVVEAEVEATRKHRVRSSTILDGIGTSTW